MSEGIAVLVTVLAFGSVFALVGYVGGFVVERRQRRDARYGAGGSSGVKVREMKADRRAARGWR